MMRPGRSRPDYRSKFAGLLAAIALSVFSLIGISLAGCGAAGSQPGAGPDPDNRIIGLFTSLPILWNEEPSLGDYLASGREQHWALAPMREYGVVKGLDTLASQNGTLPLGKADLLILAQPFPLSPQENVALDDWVNGGGHVLLFADPMLTAESSFALGDRRRPQDIVLLSPILSRWNLDLQFDEAQQMQLREIVLSSGPVPVNLPGRFVSKNGNGRCRFEGEGLLADCRIGEGRLLAIADAAMLERAAKADGDSRQKALAGLLARITE